MSIPRKRFMSSAKAREFDDDALDRLDATYLAESLRWRIRCRSPKGYELVREGGEMRSDGRFPHDQLEVTLLTLREAPTHDHAVQWLCTYRGRAAMKAVLEAL